MNFVFSLFILANTLSSSISVSEYHPLSITLKWSLAFYHYAISPLQGETPCNFTPTCSQFLKESILRFGTVKGMVISSDRLQRCNPFAWNYLDTYYRGIKNGKLYDPVNDDYTNNQSSKFFQIRLPVSSPQSEPKQQTMSEVGFADFLFQSGDYERAVLEYRRYLFSSEDLTGYAHFMLGKSLFMAESYEKAKRNFNICSEKYVDLKDLCTYEIMKIHFVTKDFDSVVTTRRELVGSEFENRAGILAGWALFKQHKFKQGALFCSRFKDASLSKCTHYNGSQVKKRSPLVATLLSSFIPGSGQAYAGRYGDGIYSFFIVSSSTALSYYYYKKNEPLKLSLFAFLTIFFQAGNIYGANLAARDFNRYQKKKYVDEIDIMFLNFDLESRYKKYFRK